MGRIKEDIPDAEIDKRITDLTGRIADADRRIEKTPSQLYYEEKMRPFQTAGIAASVALAPFSGGASMIVGGYVSVFGIRPRDK